MLSPSAAANKWANNLAAAGASIRAGIEGVTVSPTEKAARRADAYAAGVARSVADGTYQAGLRRVTLQDWKDAALSKGLARIAGGAQAAKPKMESFLADFLPHVEAGVRALENTPRGDLSQNIQRAVAMMQHNAQFRRRNS